jgi:peptide/nickel transport system substrate-binding protein
MTAFARHRRFALLLALATALLVAACGGGGSSAPAAGASGVVNGQRVEDLFGSLPAAGAPSGHGTITMGQLTGDTPTEIFPIIPSANGTDGTAFLIDQLFVPLYNLQVGGSLQVNYATSAAQRPIYSDHGRKVVIHLRKGLVWSDGKPVSAQDVLFDIALLKAAVREGADNWELYTKGLLPDNIASATAPNARTVAITFTHAYNPAYLTGDQLAGTLTPLPSHAWDIATAGGPAVNWHTPAGAKQVYDYLAKAGTTPGTFASNPLWKVDDGPFTLSSFSATNGSFDLNANQRYTLTGKVRYSTLKVETFTSTTSQFNALSAHSLDVAAIDFSQLNQVPGLRRAGYHVYGYPNIGTFGMILNFKDRTDHFGSVISQLYARQALAHLEDQPAYIKGVFKGAASTAYGPLPTVPHTPYTPSDAGTAPYSYSIPAAVKLLKDHGWTVKPSGQTTCTKPGTGQGECGAGIPAGTPFKFKLWATPDGESPSIPLESEAFASAAEQAGIEISIGTRTFNYQIQNYNDANPADARYENDWGAANWGEYGTSPYPTEQTIFTSDGTENTGGYRDPIADRLIHRTIFGSNGSAAPAAASYLAKQVPVLFLPCADVLDAVSNRIGGTSDSFLAMTQDVFYPQYWYVKK